METNYLYYVPSFINIWYKHSWPIMINHNDFVWYIISKNTFSKVKIFSKIRIQLNFYIWFSKFWWPFLLQIEIYFFKIVHIWAKKHAYLLISWCLFWAGHWPPFLLKVLLNDNWIPSGHSVQSATMATILTSALGDSISFTDYSKYWVGEPKKFSSFWQSANETSISRLYGGIHYREALTKGQELGKKVGENTLKLRFEK